MTPKTDSVAVLRALATRAAEVVHHDIDCPAIGGNGDADCRCDAVPFLRDFDAAIAALSAQGESKPVVSVGMIGHVDHGKTTLTAALTQLGRMSATPPRSDRVDD